MFCIENDSSRLIKRLFDKNSMLILEIPNFNEIGMKGHRQIISKNCPLGNTVQKVSERPSQIRLTILKLKELKFHLGKA